MTPTLLTNISRLVTMEPAEGRKGELGVIKNAVVLIDGGKIKQFCSACDVKCSGARKIDAGGCVAIPGLIDCHTHLVHAGSRVGEFAQRTRGTSYEEIAKSGGGIMSTMRATRAASEEDLFRLSAERAKESLSHGVTTIEVKSGYGLNVETELKILRVVKTLAQKLPIEFVPTFLGAHAFPDNNREKYVSLVIQKMLPAFAEERLAEFCDVFVDRIAFTAVEAERILAAAAKLGLKLKVHAEQLSESGGAALAARLEMASADHLEHATDDSISAMAKAGVVGVLIPGSTFFVGGKYAPARKMIAAGMKLAIATDYNPGTSPILNLWMAAAMAITQMKLTPEEAYRGITINAARALCLEKTRGSIAVGKNADIVLLNAESEFEPFYRFDKSFVKKVIKKGKIV